MKIKRTKKLLKELTNKLKKSNNLSDFIFNYNSIIKEFPVEILYNNSIILEIRYSKLLDNYLVIKTTKDTYMFSFSDLNKIKIRYRN